MKSGGHEAGSLADRNGRVREQVHEPLLIRGSTVKTLMNVTSLASFESVVTTPGDFIIFRRLCATS